MKLHEIAKRPRALPTEIITVEPAGGIYGEFDVVVEYDYTGASYTQHEPDDASFREYHPAEIDIGSIALNEKVFEYDEDGEKTAKFWDKGFDATKLPGWAKSDDDFILQKIADAVEEQAEDAEEDAAYDRWQAREDDRNWP